MLRSASHQQRLHQRGDPRDEKPDRRAGRQRRSDYLPGGSCTYAVKSYPTYLADEPEWALRAEKVSARMQDLTSFIVNKLGVVDVGASLQGRAVYHPSCSLTRKLGVKEEPLSC